MRSLTKRDLEGVARPKGVHGLLEAKHRQIASSVRLHILTIYMQCLLNLVLVLLFSCYHGYALTIL